MPYWIYIENIKDEDEYDILNNGKYIFLLIEQNIKVKDKVSATKPKTVKPSNNKSEIMSALQGANILLKTATGKEKAEIMAYISGLKILLK